MSSLKNLALLALATGFATIGNTQSTSGSGSTTRYWDCCKGSCSWPGKADVSNPVTMCGKDDSPLTDYNEPSAKDGGNGYMCTDQSPWVVNDDLAYGFAAVHIPGGDESTWCCACYELTFTSEKVAGKKMIVQATNTGADLAGGQFDLAIPGGGVGIYNACTNQWGAPSSGWGAQYGGISDDTCSALPALLQPGCDFRFGDWFQESNNPTVEWKTVTCPKALTDKTGCVRAGETPTGGAASSAAAPTKVASSTVESSTAPAYSAPASSSTEAAPVESSSAAPAHTAPASSSSETAPVESSTEATPAESSTASAYSAPAYSTPSSSEAAPVQSSEYAHSAPTGASSAPAAPSGTAPAEPYEGGEGACEVQYVYED